MIPEHVDDDFDASSMTSIDHRFELITISTFGLKFVRDGLITGPPLVASDMLHGGTDYKHAQRS